MEPDKVTFPNKSVKVKTDEWTSFTMTAITNLFTFASSSPKIVVTRPVWKKLNFLNTRVSHGCFKKEFDHFCEKDDDWHKEDDKHHFFKTDFDSFKEDFEFFEKHFDHFCKKHDDWDKEEKKRHWHECKRKEHDWWEDDKHHFKTKKIKCCWYQFDD